MINIKKRTNEIIITTFGISGAVLIETSKSTPNTPCFAP